MSMRFTAAGGVFFRRDKKSDDSPSSESWRAFCLIYHGVNRNSLAVALALIVRKLAKTQPMTALELIESREDARPNACKQFFSEWAQNNIYFSSWEYRNENTEKRGDMKNLF